MFVEAVQKTDRFFEANQCCLPPAFQGFNTLAIDGRARTGFAPAELPPATNNPTSQAKHVWRINFPLAISTEFLRPRANGRRFCNPPCSPNRSFQ